MSAFVAGTGQLLTTERESQLARRVLESVGGDAARLRVADEGDGAQVIPHEIAELLGLVLGAVASGRTLSISAIPETLTTSSAAALLGVSRPTLMKMIGEGVIPTHKVGTHTRLKSSDVFRVKTERRMRERAAFAALLELEGDEVN